MKSTENPVASSGITEEIKAPLFGSDFLFSSEMASIEEAFPRGKPGAGLKFHRRNKMVKPIKRKPEDKVDDLFKPQSKQSHRADSSSKANKKAGDHQDGNKSISSEKPEALSRSNRDDVQEVQCSLLQLSDLTPGMLVLGSICEIFDYRLVISLPGGIRGFVSISDICDAYTNDLKSYASNGSEQPALLQLIFRVGQLVQCRVTDRSTKEIEPHSKKNKKQATSGGGVKVTKESLNLSINPRLVNADLGSNESSLGVGMLISGVISGVEEKGYVVDLGFGPTCKAFVKSSDASEFEQQFNAGNRLSLYQVLPFVVAEVKPGFVGLKLENWLKKTEFENLPIRCILPGLVLRLDVLEQRRNGLVLQMTSGGVNSSNPIIGCVHWRHAPASLDTYKVGKTLSVSVLYVDPLTKTLHCSLSRHLRKLNGFDSTAQPQLSAIGRFFDEAKVLRIDGKRGVIFEVSGEEGELIFNRAYAKLAHLSDRKSQSIDDQKFAPGTKHRCRVVGLSYIDGCYVVSFKQSILDNKFQSLAGVNPGDKVSATVEAVVAEGLRVSLDQAKFIPGFIPWTHATDTKKETGNFELLEKRFPLGSKLKCRVLSVEPDRNRLILTSKKRLVKSKLPIFSDLSSIVPGQSTSDGYVMKIMGEHKGLLVGFYGRVVGYLPRSLLPPYCRSAQDLRILFHPGQVITCRAKSVDLEKNQFVVEMVTNDDQEAADETIKAANEEQLSQLKSPSTGGDKNGPGQPQFELGQLIEGFKIISRRETGFQVLIDEKIVATLPFEHLSDFPENSSILSSHLKTDNQIFQGDKLVVISNKTRLIVSRKATLIESIARNRFSRSFDDIQPGRILAGWVVSVADYGLFVAFPGNFVALAPKKFIADRFIVNPTALFKRGQSVIAKVIESNAERDEHGRQRIIVSLRMRDVRPQVTTRQEDPPSSLMKAEDGCQLMDTFFEEQRLLASEIVHTEKFPIGSIIDVIVSEIDSNNDEIICRIEGTDLVAKIPKEQMAPSFKNSSAATVGLKLRSVVLHHDFANNRIEVTANPGLVADVAGKLEEPALPLLPGQLLASEVQLVRGGGIFALVSLRDHATGRFARVPTRRHLNDVLEPFQFVQGQVNQVFIKDHNKLASAIFKNHQKKAAAPRKDVSSQETSSAQLLPSGSIVSAEIVNMTPTVLNLKLEDGKFRGRVHITETAPDEKQVAGFQPFAELIKGQKIKVRVLGLHHRAVHKQVRAKMFECSLLLEKPAHRTRPLLGEGDVMEGQKVPIFVKEYRHQFAIVEFSRLISRPARICRLNVADETDQINQMASGFPPGTCLGVAEVIRTSPYVEFSLIGRPCRVEPGRVYQGLVFSKSSSIGLYVAFADGSTGHVGLTDIVDKFDSFPTRSIAQNCVIPCFVMKRFEADASWQVSIRPSRVVKPEINVDSKITDREIDSAGDLIIGDRLRGFVVACKEHSGVFVRLGLNVVGRSSFEHTSDHYLIEPEKFFQPGLLVLVKVVAIDYRDPSRHVEISLLERDTGEALAIPKALMRGKRKELSNLANKQEGRKRARTESGSSVHSGESISSKKSMTKEPEPEGEAKFDFSQSEIVQPPLISSSSVAEVEEEMEIGGDEKKKAKKETAREREQRTYAMEMARLRGADDPEAAEPKSVDDFDRLVIEKPNSSLVWARYVAFHLANLDVAKAREIAERALKSVSFREEAERLNVWVAYFNLENMFGTDDSLRDIVRRACQEADPLAVYERLVDVYVKADKFEAAEHQLALLTKKYRENPTVWLKQGEFLFEHGKADTARGVLNKALDALDLRNHVDLIVKFALLEMERGDFERGRSLFEKVVTNYPRRLDVWNVYVDALLKKGQQRENDVVGARRLYERQVALRLPYNKARLVFRRFAAFEKQFGDEESMAKVEELAKQFLEQQGEENNDDKNKNNNETRVKHSSNK